MITYLAVTSVLNIALGYALAVYLGQTRTQPTVSTTPRPSSPPVSTATPTPPPLAATAARIDPQPAPAAAADDKGWAEAFLKSEAAAEAVAAESVAATPVAVEPVLASPPADAAPAEEYATPVAEVDEPEPVVAPALAMEAEEAEDESPAAEPAAASTEVEQELLAGIEEFRNQLAQLKGGVAEAPAAERVAGLQTS